MSLMTPRGLKIRLELPWAFGLMGRLWRKDPNTDAFTVLKTVEAIEHIPTLLTVIVGLIVALPPNSGSLFWIVLSMLSARIVGSLLTIFGVFIVLRPLGLLWLATVKSWMPRVVEYGLVLVAGYSLIRFRGWSIIPVWLGAYFMASVIDLLIIGIWSARRWHRLTGFAFSPSELFFFHAYRLHADRLGLTRDLHVAATEAEANTWRDCLADYAEKWPEAVERFPDKVELGNALAGIS